MDAAHYLISLLPSLTVTYWGALAANELRYLETQDSTLVPAGAVTVAKGMVLFGLVACTATAAFWIERA